MLSEQKVGIIGTFIVHNIILLILIMSFITIRNNIPAEGGMIINFGNTQIAGGEREPYMNNAPQQQQATAVETKSETSDRDGIMTQDFEEAPVVAKKPEKKAEAKKPSEKPAETKPQTTTKPVEETPKVNTKALYSAKGKSTEETGTSQGLYKGSGNQGSEDGSPDSDNYGLGSGSGLGIQIGGGLENRPVLSLPKPEFRVQKEGRVVVEVVVNREGKVISANPGVKGTTIVDADLYAAAKKAALQSKFAVKPDAQAFQTQIGTITYIYKLE
jgi:TonB family protein